MIKIVITGGDASGKSTVWDYLRKKYPNVIQEIPEMATALTGGLGGVKILPALGRDIDVTPEVLGIFQESMRSVQLSSEQMWEIVARANGKKACVFDRGIPDTVAYTPGGWDDITTTFGMTKEQIYARYDIVINLRSLAYRDPDRYTEVLKENPSRTPRSVGKAVELDKAILEAWKDHPNLIVLDADIEDVLLHVEQIVLEETSREIERKFYLGNKLPLIARSSPELVIGQEQAYYFTSPGELRYRKEQIGDRLRFFQTVKSDGQASRMEWEHELQPAEFSLLWKMTKYNKIVKTRYIVRDNGLLFEIDLYKEPDMFVVVEVEFESMEAYEAFSLPDWMEGAIDVTNNLDMKAKNIAAHGFKVPA